MDLLPFDPSGAIRPGSPRARLRSRIQERKPASDRAHELRFQRPPNPHGC